LVPTVGIAATGFCYLGGSFNFFIDKISKFFIDKISKFFVDKISKFCGCRQQQQLDHFWPAHSDQYRDSTQSRKFSASAFINL
jgi:hypothetical protein